jgi:hypothetical protein
MLSTARQCTRCKADWCWLCGQDISQRATGHDVDYHYNPTNLRGCPGSQFSQGNGEYLCLDRATSFLWWVLFAATLAAAGMGYLGLLVAAFLGTGCCLGGFCFCCFGTRRCPDGMDSELLQAVLLGPPLALAFLAMTLLWALVAVVRNPRPGRLSRAQSLPILFHLLLACRLSCLLLFENIQGVYLNALRSGA